MKKLNILLIALMFSSATLFSKSVDVNHAMQVAQSFFKQTTGQMPTLTLAYQCQNTQSGNGVAFGETLYYAFNVSDNGGFIMVSAEDLVKPILGYNTQGQFAIQNAPSVITSWYTKYTNQIIYAKANMTTTAQQVTDLWTAYDRDPSMVTKQLRSGAVAPLVQTTWDQDLNYNALCPSDPNSPQGYGGHVPTGCGATAMSQIMRYWQYPAMGSGSNSYTSNYGTLSANFGNTSYNWGNMPLSVTSPNNDVATIMFDCGVAVDMVYGPTESSSYMVNEGGVAASCQAAYTTYFGYNASTMQGLDRSNYSNESDWTGMIDGELAAGRPIQYAGHGSDGGHTFVLDGSDGNGNYHINWGWSGADNGFYSVDDLVPAPYSNGDFDEGEQMLIGIEPSGTTVVTTGLQLYQATVVTPDPIGFLSTFSVSAAAINNSQTAFTGNYCAALFDASGNFIRFVGDILSTTGLPYNYYNTLTFSDTTTFVTVPGDYILGIYYQASGATTWTLVSPASYTNPIEVTVSGPTDPGISLYSTITPAPATFVQEQPASVNVNLTNDGLATFYGSYEAVLLDLQGNYLESIGTYTESQGLPVGYDYNSPYITFSTGSITVPEGEYILAIAEEAQGTSNWYYCGEGNYSNPVLINVVNSGVSVQPGTGIQDVAAGQMVVYPNPATNIVNILPGDAHGDYTLTMYDMLGQQVRHSTGTLISGQAVTTDVSDLASGLYTIKVATGSGVLTSSITVK